MTTESPDTDLPLEDLFARSAERVLLFIRMRLGTKLAARMEPMDVLQDTWVEAEQSFPGFTDRGPGAFMAWICRIAENRIRALADHYGAAKRTPPGEPLPVSRVLERVRAELTGPVTAAARREDQDRLGDALSGLEEDEREALLLRHFLGRTFDEVADALGLTPTTARRLVGRATVRLGRILREKGGES